MTVDFSPVSKLEKSDDCTEFDSGAPELDDWLRRFAYENLRANNAVTYVTRVNGIVAGYFSIAVAGVEKAHAPAGITKGSVPSAIPCILLARLAVDVKYQGCGVGVGLLKDALQRTAQVSESIGARALLIHARDEGARDFYEKHCESYRTNISELQLMIPMKYIRSNFL